MNTNTLQRITHFVGIPFSSIYSFKYISNKCSTMAKYKRFRIGFIKPVHRKREGQWQMMPTIHFPLATDLAQFNINTKMLNILNGLNGSDVLILK
jgi:hypothetical protein